MAYRWTGKFIYNGDTMTVDDILTSNLSMENKKNIVDQINDYLNSDLIEVGHFIPEIENTVFNGDTTIIIWKDKTKTIVHCEPDKPRDPYAAFCAAVCKKLFGSTDKVMKVIADTDKAYQAKLRAEAAAKKKAENIAKQEELKAKAETRRKEADEAIREAFYTNEKLRREAKKRLKEEEKEAKKRLKEEEKGGEA